MSHSDQQPETATRESIVRLREMTSDNFEEVLRLKVAPDQEEFVAPNVASIAEAHFSDQAWYRAIYADETPVGFVMLSDETLGDYENPLCCGLWRLMIDQRYQRMGFGKRALELIVEHVHSQPPPRILLTSYLPGDDSAKEFYEKFGFKPTGAIDNREIAMRYDL